MARVAYDHVTKMFDDVVAVDDLMLEVEDGEFLVLVGPSGCGKSTALRCLAGLERVTSGDIVIEDRVVNNVLPKDRDIAMVFQNYALYPNMDVRGNLAFGLRMRGIEKREISRRVEDTAKMLGLDGLLDRKPRQLSGGQRQRVALGRAIVREPQAFLMDEPLSNLDAKLRVQTRAEITRLQKRLGTTTIYVTHDQTEAMTMGHRIAVMSHGVLQQLDTPKNLYDQPANLFVATFIGSPAMNIFPTSVVRDGDQIRLVADGVSLGLPATRGRKLREQADDEVLVGIRPEDFSLRSGRPVEEERVVRLPVELVEQLGSEQMVHLRGPNDDILIARVDARAAVEMGETVDLIVDTEQLHVFDPGTEQAIA